MIGHELLQGEKVRLSAVSKADAPVIATWYQHGEYLRMFDSNPALPRSVDDIEAMLEEHRKDKNTCYFGIRRVTDDALVGDVALEHIEWNQGAAWLGIGLGPEHWNQGLGTEAMQLVLYFAFQELNLYRVQLTVFAYNERALAVYRKVGFKHEGTFREYLCRDGQRYDMYLMGILEREWRANLPHPC